MASVFKRGGKRAKGRWYASWVDHNGKRHTKSTRTTDKATAERIANKNEADAALRREGVIDPTLDTASREARRSIDSHLSDYEHKMRASNRTDDHVRRTVGTIRKIANWAEFITASNITADGVNRYAAKMNDDGLSPRTIQAHLTAIKGFTKWLADHHKLPRDPLVSVKKPNPEADRRLERRMLLLEEWPLISDATLTGPRKHGMTGPERELLYRTAIQTGLRSSELRTLTPGQLHLDTKQPYITCKARSTKNRKDAQQFIPVDLAADLKVHINEKPPKAPVFNLPHETNMAKMLRADLTTARNQWLAETSNSPDAHAQRAESDFLLSKNHDEKSIDFHSLRHTCGAWLALTGTQPNVIQQVMRHSSIVLTMDTYGHLLPGQEADAINRMNDLFSVPKQPPRIAVGGVPVAERENGAQRKAQQLQCGSLPWGATGDDDQAVPDATPATPKPLRITVLDEGTRRKPQKIKNRPGRIRTSDQGIMSPLL